VQVFQGDTVDASVLSFQTKSAITNYVPGGEEGWKFAYKSALALALGISPSEVAINGFTFGADDSVLVDLSLQPKPRTSSTPDTVLTAQQLYEKLQALVFDPASALNANPVTHSRGVLQLCPGGGMRTECRSDETIDRTQWLVTLGAVFIMLAVLVFALFYLWRKMAEFEMNAKQQAVRDKRKQEDQAKADASLARGLADADAQRFNGDGAPTKAGERYMHWSPQEHAFVDGRAGAADNVYTLSSQRTGPPRDVLGTPERPAGTHATPLVPIGDYGNARLPNRLMFLPPDVPDPVVPAVTLQQTPSKASMDILGTPQANAWGKLPDPDNMARTPVSNGFFKAKPAFRGMILQSTFAKQVSTSSTTTSTSSSSSTMTTKSSMRAPSTLDIGGDIGG
jgi:hypothetical protein